MNKSEGFTLLELLVVIAIIGIISAIAFATLTSSTNKAEISAFKHEISALQPALVSVCDGTAGATLVGASELAAAGTREAGVIVTDCQSEVFEVTFEPVEGEGGSCTLATVTQNGSTFTDC